MKRNWIGAGVAVGAIAVGAGIFWSAGNTTRANESVSTLPIRGDTLNLASAPATGAPAVVQRVSLTDTPQWTEVPGTVRPELESSVAAKVTGRVARVAVREGDPVRQGEILVDLDARDLDASVNGAAAGLQAAHLDISKAQTAQAEEVMLDQARVGTAEAALVRSKAAVNAAQARYDAVKAGPRPQERAEAAQAVAGAQASLTLAESNLRKITSLFQQGAVSRQFYESTVADAQVARARLESAKEAESLALEGSRSEDIRAAAGVVKEAQAAVVQAQAGLDQARAEALQVNLRRQEVLAAQAQDNQSRAALDTAEITRAFANIAAPFDGIVSARLVDPGDMAAPGVPLLKIQGGRLRIEAIVPENNLRFVRLGDALPVEIDALNGKGRSLAGRVVEISPQGDPASHTFVIKAQLPANSGAKPGMFARVRFPAGASRQLLVPLSAVWTQQGLHYLFVVDSANIARLRMVTIGDPIGDRVPVLSGVNPGETIVVAGRERVSDGVSISREPGSERSMKAAS